MSQRDVRGATNDDDDDIFAHSTAARRRAAADMPFAAEDDGARRVFADESHSREPACARGALADDDAEAAAGHEYAEHVTPSEYVPFRTSFLNEQRYVLRHVVPVEELDADGGTVADADDDGRTAGHRDDPASHVRRSAATEYFDVYAQLGHAPMHQDPQTLADFARDLANPVFLETTESAIRESAAPPTAAVASRAERLARADALRANIARAMMTRRGVDDVFSLDYLRLVPPEHVDAFTALHEVAAIVGALVPLLYVPSSARTHLTERALDDVLGCAGCTRFGARTLELALVSARDPLAAYGGAAGAAYEGAADAHAHVASAAPTTPTMPAAAPTIPITIVTYLCTGIPVPRDASIEAARAASATAPSSSVSAHVAAAARPLGSTGGTLTDADMAAVASTASSSSRTLMYLVDVVAHRLTVGVGGAPRLCFRTFVFRSELLSTAAIRAALAP